MTASRALRSPLEDGRMSLAQYREGPEPTTAGAAAEWNQHLHADTAASGLGGAALLLQRAMQAKCVDMGLPGVVTAMEHADEAVNALAADDMSAAKRMLAAHAVALNVMFLQQVAQDGAPGPLAVALTAQRQCTAAIDALAAIHALKAGRVGADGAA